MNPLFYLFALALTLLLIFTAFEINQRVGEILDELKALQAKIDKTIQNYTDG